MGDVFGTAIKRREDPELPSRQWRSVVRSLEASNPRAHATILRDPAPPALGRQYRVRRHVRQSGLVADEPCRRKRKTRMLRSVRLS